jgi:hypothetical protein
MAKSIALAVEASRLASLRFSYIPAVCAFVAPRQPGVSTAIIDRLSHSRALSNGVLGSVASGRGSLPLADFSVRETCPYHMRAR